MAVDASGLKRRKGLGSPPTGGTPGMEADAASTRRGATQAWAGDHGDADSAPLGTATAPDPALQPREKLADDAVEPPSRLVRQRVSLPEAEARVPFTTRVTASTKERLENACYHLRRRHQDFINEAIAEHLKRHGF